MRPCSQSRMSRSRLSQDSTVRCCSTERLAHRLDARIDAVRSCRCRQVIACRQQFARLLSAFLGARLVSRWSLVERARRLAVPRFGERPPARRAVACRVRRMSDSSSSSRRSFSSRSISAASGRQSSSRKLSNTAELCERGRCAPCRASFCSSSARSAVQPRACRASTIARLLPARRSSSRWTSPARSESGRRCDGGRPSRGARRGL